MRMKTIQNNQVVVEVDNRAVFFSYDTEIASLAKNPETYGWEIEYLTDSWDYSKTTLRYLYVFLKEYNIHFEMKGEKMYGSTASTAQLRKHIEECLED